MSSHRATLFCTTTLLIVFATLAMAGDPVTPATAESFRISRREAVDMAVAANPQIAAAKEQVEQAHARITEATALPDPSFVTTLEEMTSFLHPGTATTQDFGIGFTVPFPTKLHLAGRVAETAMKSTEQSLILLRQQITMQTYQAYDALLVALLHQENLKKAKSLADDFLAKTQARFEAGTVAKLDVIKARVDAAQAENDLIANERAITTARAGLNRLLARSLAAPIDTSDTLEVPSALPGVDELEKLAQSSRPEILSNLSDREGATKATKLANQFWLPDISLTLSRNYTAGNPPAYSMAGSATLPLLFWQHTNGAIAEAKHHEAELAATAKDLKAQVGLDVRTTYATANTALRQAVFIRDELLPEAREAFRIASTSYELGGASALDVLDAKRTMLDAETQYADALGAANDARADLERAVAAPLPASAGDTHEQ